MDHRTQIVVLSAFAVVAVLFSHIQIDEAQPPSISRATEQRPQLSVS